VWINSSGTVNSFSTSTWTNVISIEPFDDGVIALRANGTVSSVNGGSSPPFTLTNVLAISSGRYQGLALKRDGKIVEWPQTLLSTNLVSITAVASAPSQGPDFAVLSDGSVIGAGGFFIGSTNVPHGLANVVRLDAGYNHALALLADRDFPPVFLHNALNTTNFIVSSKGAPQWFGETSISHDGTNAAQSAAIGNNTASSMRMWSAGSVKVIFWWKVSSAANHGVLNFSAGGNVLTNISGEVDWQQVTLNLPPGNQILQWTYTKDGSPAAGQDAAWVDQLQFSNLPPTILVQPQPASQDVLGGSNVTYSVTAFGTPPLTYNWRKDGITILSGPAPATNLILNNVTRNNSATYQVVVSSPYGVMFSSNVVLNVHVPQLLGAPTLNSDGSISLSSTNSDGTSITSAELANLQVQATTNLVDWVTLSNALVLTNGAIQLQDADATNSASRFYRIVETW
jgi:hypothetical protein